MARMEQESQKRRKKQNLQRALLFTLATAGIIAWAVMAPNTLRLLKYLPGDPIRYRLKTAAGKLVAKGYAVWVKKKGAYCLRLTEKGSKALALEQSVLSFNSPKRTWDGRWRIVTFDVPERRRGVRGRLRMMMKSVGFIRLQESVWVYPYDCEEFMALLKAELKIGRNVLYVIADSIEQDSALRKHFSLPSV